METKFNINSPRLIHGTSILNLESVIKEGALSPSAFRKDRHSTKANWVDTNFDGGTNFNQLEEYRLYFNILGAKIKDELYSMTRPLWAGFGGIDDYVNELKGLNGQRVKFEHWIFDLLPATKSGHIKATGFYGFDNIFYQDENIQIKQGGKSLFIDEKEPKFAPNLLLKITNKDDLRYLDENFRNAYPTNGWELDNDKFNFLIRLNPKFLNHLWTYKRDLLRKYLDEKVLDEIEKSIKSAQKLPLNVNDLLNHPNFKYCGYDCYFLINEDFILNKAKTFPPRKRDESLLDPRNPIKREDENANYDVYGVGLEIKYIERIKNMRQDIDLPNDHYIAEYPFTHDGIFVNYGIDLEGIAGLVVSPIERKNYLPSEIKQKDSQEVGSFVAKLFEKYKVPQEKRFPIFDFYGGILYDSNSDSQQMKGGILKNGKQN
ncbi:MAG: hypothetical protein ACOYT4_03845 [Nanoarchaeota archaeon]